MPVTKTSAIEDKKKQAEQASENQMQDLMAAISGLGTSKGSNSFEIKAEPAEEKISDTKEGREEDNFKTVTNPADDKPGYVSLVIPNSLKKKWKLYSTQHGMSLTDSLKLGMKLLEEMEAQGKIKIEEGFLTLNA